MSSEEIKHALDTLIKNTHRADSECSIIFGNAAALTLAMWQSLQDN